MQLFMMKTYQQDKSQLSQHQLQLLPSPFLLIKLNNLMFLQLLLTKLWALLLTLFTLMSYLLVTITKEELSPIKFLEISLLDLPAQF